VTRLASEKIEKGDIVWLEFDAWTVNPNGTQTLFDTTHEEVAKKEDKFEEKKVYIAQPVVVGKGRLFVGLEEAIVGAKIGETKQVTIPPEKAEGARDARLVELKTEREFLRQEINPEVGLEVSINGKRGTITSAAAGRVRIDFNKPLAGKTLKYEFKAIRKASTPEERIRAILDMDYGLAEQFKIQLKGDAVELQLPDVSKTDEKWFVMKFRVVADLRDLTDLRRMRFVEEYEKKVEAPKEKGTEPKPAKGAEEKPAAAAEAKAAPAKPKGRKARQPKPVPSPEEIREPEKTPEEL
jgi:FKBP-type peptidyl-prolyl cis-trans isomerase SlyD